MSGEKEVFRIDQPHGMGEVFISWQRGSGTYLATTGVDQTVSIYNRNGRRIEVIRLMGMCTGFGWDADGDLLAAASQGAPFVILWDSNTGKRQQVDTGLREPLSCVVWSKTGPFLAMGTTRGNLAIYNHVTAKRVPVLGKHSKRISCGAWSSENLLALGSEDKNVSISNLEGDTLRMISLRFEPSDIQFSEMKLDERVGVENTVSLLVGRKTLFLNNLHDPDNPIELAFQHKYGLIVAYKWFGDGYILLGFMEGYFIAISTHIKEVGQELFQVKNHKESLTDIALSNVLGKVASCGDNVVKIHDMKNLQETSSVISIDHEIGIERLSWSEDGQLLALTTRSGSVYAFLSCLPVVNAVHGLQIAVLTSLTELTLFNYELEDKSNSPLVICLELPVEPTWVSLGPYHCAAGMNNRAWFYDITRNITDGEQLLMLKDREYLGTVTSVYLNTEYASVLYEGKIQLHMIEAANGENEDRETRLFPDESSLEMNITAHSLTTDFLIFASDIGHVCYFYLEDWKIISEYRHTVGIRALYADQAGSRLIIVDVSSDGYIYSPVSNEIFKIPNFPTSCSGCLWDYNDRNTFVAFSTSVMYTFIYIKDSMTGPTIEMVGSTKVPANQIPLLLTNGQVTLQTTGGRLTQLTLSTHEITSPNIHDSQKGSLEQALQKQLILRRYDEAWKTCQVLNTKESWTSLAEAALKSLDIDLAIQVYRHIGDVGMVWSLQDIQDIDDQKLLAGHVAMFLKDFDKAQEWYLKSRDPEAALKMRRDLLQWDQALQLANKLAPEQIPYIAREYAQQLEFIGNYSEALSHYERGLSEVRSGSARSEKPNSKEEAHILLCRAGVARTAIRDGDIRRGVAIAADVNSNKTLKKECAEILESMKQFSDAAMLYESGQYFDKAALMYIRLKNWLKVGELLPLVASNKIHLQYAKAKEADGKYKEAIEAYRSARDYDSMIRLYLDHLNSPEEAIKIVEETKSIEGAKMVAKFFQRLNDYSSAIRFLVLSHCHNEAFQLARQHGQMKLYGEVLITTADSEARPDDYRSLALHFETERNFLLAGKYFFYAGEYTKALKHLLQVLKSNSEDAEAIDLAIDTVGKSKDDYLASQLIEFLLGETDGVPKDPKYLFRLYMARSQYREAAKTAIIIANEEQINGSYRSAHDMLFIMYQELRHNGIKIPLEMQLNLMLLHSYILAKLHVKREQHTKAARMLIRVANNISKFPSHTVPILTSTVIECSRAGLKMSAFNFAATLMRAEYRSKIDPKYAKKIETVVRKPNRSQQSEETEQLTPCPYCECLLAETELNCGSCKNNIPYCIATGCHIVKNDLTACPKCDFPAIYTEFQMLINSGEKCPMCSDNIDKKSVQLVDDPTPYLYQEGED